MKQVCLSALSISLLASLSLMPASAAASGSSGNTTIDSFNFAKRLMEQKVVYDRRITLYCSASFDARKNTTLPKGFAAPNHKGRSDRVEWEHVVPAENFGRAFPEWREGSPSCTDSKGRSFKGRKCAEKMNKTYRYMQSDMYNLYPAVGSVNAERGNKNFEMLPGTSSFGSCAMKVQGNKAEPPDAAKGAVARTYKYMEGAYPMYRMSAAQRRLMDAWDRQYPVQAWECVRAQRIEAIQGNENPAVKSACKARGLWR